MNETHRSPSHGARQRFEFVRTGFFWAILPIILLLLPLFLLLLASHRVRLRAESDGTTTRLEATYGSPFSMSRAVVHVLREGDALGVRWQEITRPAKNRKGTITELSVTVITQSQPPFERFGQMVIPTKTTKEAAEAWSRWLGNARSA